MAGRVWSVILFSFGALRRRIEGGRFRDAAAAMSFAAGGRVEVGGAAEGMDGGERAPIVDVGGKPGGTIGGAAGGAGAGAGCCAAADCSIMRSGWNQCSTVVATSFCMTSMSIMKTMNLLSGTISPLGPTSIADGIVTTGSVATSFVIFSTVKLSVCGGILTTKTIHSTPSRINIH